MSFVAVVWSGLVQSGSQLARDSPENPTLLPSKSVCERES